jgi:hypothetical protein
MPAGGAAATRVIRLMDGRSGLTAFSDRVTPRVIGSVVDPDLASTANLVDTGMTGEILRERPQASATYQLDQSGVADLPPCALLRTGSFTGEVGLDLLQWGDINDVTANNDETGAMHWVRVGSATVEIDGSDQYLRLQPSNTRSASARPIARSGTPLHRWFDTKLDPIDGEPSYTVRMRTRASGVSAATLRIAVYDVNDTDPTTEPVSTLIRETSLPLEVVDSSEWRQLDFDVTEAVNTPIDGARPNAVLIYLELPAGSPSLDVDDGRLVEWRDLALVPDDQWVPADAMRAVPEARVTVDQSGCGVPTS